MIKIGDVFCIPLANQKYAFGQFVIKDKMGPIIRISNHIDNSSSGNRKYSFNNLLFPPVLSGLYAAIRENMWSIIDRKPITNFIYPGFISNYYHGKNGEAGLWFDWDGKRFTQLGNYLPEDYKGCEYLVVWSPQDIVKRIETGESPFPYTDLILKNRFTPK